MVNESDNDGGLFGRLVGKSRRKASKSHQAPQPAEKADPGKAKDKVAPAQSETGDTAAKPDAASKGSVQAAQPAQSTAAPIQAPLFQAPIFQAPVFQEPVFTEPARKSSSGSSSDDSGENHGSSHRRRARRKEGEEADVEVDARTVVKVRPKRQTQDPDAPTPVKGSTRLEAKRQRRSSGRDAGRRRSVITDVEFQARREAVDRQMVVRSTKDRIQIGVLEDGVLVEHYVAKSQDQSLIGNVYLGKVQNVLPSMEAAFVDIGRGRNAVLYSGEVDWDAAETGNNPRRIEFALKAGDTVLVQVTKDPVGHKGARLTSQISLPGRYLVYVPGGSMNGISRKLPDTERARLKKVLKEVLPESAGVIVRTAAEGATEEQLTVDVRRLQNQWEELQKLIETSQSPALLHSEPDLLLKIVRDVFNEDFSKMVVSGSDALQTITKYIKAVAPELLDRIETYDGNDDVFDHYRINETIDKALDRKVWLPSGGSLVIDRTEAMTVIDVNTGKFVGSGGNLEETVTKNNLEAAEEIIRQLRLRDIGGIIVVDFIDMVLEANRDLVLRRVIECLGRDRTKHQVAEVTSLGLVQMTRKKIGIGLLESFSEPCEVCGGRGVVVHTHPVIKQQRSSQQERSSRNRKSDRSSAAQQEAKQASAPTLSEDVKLAVAQIAASTIATKAGGDTDDAVDASAHSDSAVADAGTKPPTKRSRSSRSRSSQAPASDKAVAVDPVVDPLSADSAATDTIAANGTAGESSEVVVAGAGRNTGASSSAKSNRSRAAKKPAIDLELPIARVEPRVVASPADKAAVGTLLDSALDALAAEPKSATKPPARRSRRASLPTGQKPDTLLPPHDQAPE